VIAGCAVMCGADTGVDMEAYGRAKSEGWQRFLALPQAMPSHDTCARLQPEAFRTCLLAWLREVQEERGGPLASQQVALDGQAARHRFDRALDRGPLHRVSAWATAAPVG
jgi:DDE_Tnp_1-associated